MYVSKTKCLLFTFRSDSQNFIFNFLAFLYISNTYTIRSVHFGYTTTGINKKLNIFKIILCKLLFQI
jgi:hypothetical protein